MTYFDDARRRAPHAFGLAAAAFAAIAAAGCSGGTSSTPSTPVRTPEVQFVFAIPIAVPASSLRRRAFVSPSTRSAKIVVQSGTAVAFTGVVPLTATSPGCSQTAAATTCAVSVALAPGTYDANVTTYDDAAAQGHVLGAATAVPFEVSSGGSNTVAIDVDGVPARIAVKPSASAEASGSQATGFVLFGAAPVSFVIEALDADGNDIVGAGAPTYAASAGTGFSVVQPTTAAPNVFELQPPGKTGAATSVTIAANAGATNVCSEAAAVCATTFAAKNDAQTLFIQDGTTIGAYAAPFTGTPTTLAPVASPPSASLGVAGSDGDLFVAITNNNSGAIERFAKPYTSPASTISGGLSFPGAMALDAKGDLFVANETQNVLSFAPPYTAAGTVVSGYPYAAALATSASGNLFITNLYATTSQNEPIPGGDMLEIYEPPIGMGGRIVAIPDGETTSNGQERASAASLAVAPSGNLFIGYADKIVVLPPPYTSKPLATIALPAAPQVLYPPPYVAPAVDASENVFVAVPGGIEIFAPPYTSPPKMVAAGVSADSQYATSIIVDAIGNLIVATASNATGGPVPAVVAYAPPYTGAPVTIHRSSGILPVGIAVTP